MKGWILYSTPKDHLNDSDHGVQRLLSAAQKKDISLEVFIQPI